MDTCLQKSIAWRRGGNLGLACALLALAGGCGEVGGEVGGETATGGERTMASPAGRGAADEVACPVASCAAAASRHYDVLSCQGGKMLVRCSNGKPRCYACNEGHSCSFGNGGSMQDDFCKPDACTPCTALAKRAGAVATCDQATGALVRCVGGCMEREPCAAGCTYNNGGSGQDDFCNDDCRPCNATARRTGAIWGCDAANRRLVRCKDGCMDVKPCADGCTWNNGGTGQHDVCGSGGGGGGGGGSGGGGCGVTGGCQYLQRWQVECLLRWAGFPEWSIPEMARIAYCESTYYTCAVSRSSSNPNQDWGLLQISVDSWLFAGETYNDMLNPWTNVSRAKYVFNQQGLGAWVCHYL